MNRNHLITFVLCFLFSPILMFSQHFLRTSGKVIVNELGDTVLLRGMGLGGWMLQEGYMLQTQGFANAQHQIRAKIEELIGESDTDLFYDAWLSNHMRKIDIDSMKAWGFNSVRLPMHYNLFTLPVEDEPVAGQHTWLTKGFELTDSLISWCKQNEMYVILDLHAAPGGQGYDQGISDYDPEKPSLWESKANRDKTVALWKKLAERYVNEPWVGGYDLINEPNWDLPGNGLLRTLYQELTDTIRSVDDRHIIFIEGNWFANDFTGLTPPWDPNMVYAPHKYWSHNKKSDIQWVLTLRDQYNIPLYFGESGENSNAWFRDAIRLIEDHKIGWAWWPLKKIESISCPLSVVKTQGYQTLLNYWDGGGNQPSAAFTKATLMEMAENLKFENCVYQRDVIDAMFRQVYSDEALPFITQTIPGMVYASDYDLGVVGSAYHDSEVATYHVSTGTYTAWNTGWTYRNDGVDIEPSFDFKSNGYNVGWVEEDEWIQYDVEVQENGIYDIHVRIATNTFTGKLHFQIDGADICIPYFVPVTGGWQNWQTLTIPDVVLDTSNTKLRLYADGSGFNISSFEFIRTGSSTDIQTEFISANTANNKTIEVHLNKPLRDPIPAAPANFQIFANGNSIDITEVIHSQQNSRLLLIEVDQALRSVDDLKISYNGNGINAVDGSKLQTFSLEDIKNTLPELHQIPGRIQAEDFFFQNGVQLEACLDVGGGMNIGYLDVGDYLDYNVLVAEYGLYNIDYRTASQSSTGGLELQIIDENGNASVIQENSFPSTGDWQSWTTTSNTVVLNAGQYIFRIVITQPLFNLNWFEFSFLSYTEDEEPEKEIYLFPNPSSGLFYLDGINKYSDYKELQVYDIKGNLILSNDLTEPSDFQNAIDLRNKPNGHYLLYLQRSKGAPMLRKLVKIKE